MTMTKVFLSSFKASNHTEQIRLALDYCRQTPGTTLVMEPGAYEITDPLAVKTMDSAMNGEFGNSPEPTIFTPYYPYARGMDFRGCKDITIEAYGASLLCHGWMEPVSLEACENITIKGLTIDYRRKAYSFGKVVAVGENYIDVSFPEKYPVNPKMPTPRIIEFCPVSREFTGLSFSCDNKEQLAPQLLRFYFNPDELINPAMPYRKVSSSQELLGKSFYFWHSFHFRPGILILEARDILLDGVVIHNQPGMGIVGHRSHNITAKGIKIIPEPGEFMSVDTDATHFTSCTGLLRFDGCMFEGHGDDAINVHSYYQTISNVSGRQCDITVKAPTGTHAQVLDYPDEGAVMELVSRKSLKDVRTYRVKSVEPFPNEWRARITLDDELPENFEEYYLSDITRLPRLEFVNCRTRNNIARAVLVKTRNVLIENCFFESSTLTALHIAAEGWWHEGVASKNVVVRGNYFLNCCNTAGPQEEKASAIHINISAEDETCEDAHENILIEGNIIHGSAKYGILACNTKGLVIKNNEIGGVTQKVKVEYCRDAVVLQ